MGDEVRVEPGAHDDWAIVEILPRRSKLARRAPGAGYGERILAANVAFITGSVMAEMAGRGRAR